MHVYLNGVEHCHIVRSMMCKVQIREPRLGVHMALIREVLISFSRCLHDPMTVKLDFQRAIPRLSYVARISNVDCLSFSVYVPFCQYLRMASRLIMGLSNGVSEYSTLCVNNSAVAVIILQDRSILCRTNWTVNQCEGIPAG